MPAYTQPIQPQPGKLKIVELFETVQGEGHLAGVPSTFVRTGACNLECPGCDTVWDKWTETSFEEIAAKVRSHSSRHVVLTGGEPTMWQAGLAALMEMLPQHHFTVETNGAVPLTVQKFKDSIDLWSFSPKVGSLGPDEMSPRQEETVLENLALLRGRQVQIKYVVDPDNDAHINRVFEFQFHVGLRAPYLLDTDIYFQPYDTETLVNIHHAPGLDDVLQYLRRLTALTKVVAERSEGRFRVLPQLHKLLAWR
jgi:organic radical activating enzyme